jgi:hypothetical protein
LRRWSVSSSPTTSSSITRPADLIRM